MPTQQRNKTKKENDLKNCSKSCKKINAFFTQTKDNSANKASINEVPLISIIGEAVNEEPLNDEPLNDEPIINPSASDFDIIEIKNNNYISDAIKYKLLQGGFNIAKNYTFPKDPKKRNRSFKYDWLYSYLWLRYSKIEDGGYCIYCSLFHDKKENTEQVFVNLPFRNWPNSASSFKTHRESTKH
jgi:hypothetical protein